MVIAAALASAVVPACGADMQGRRTTLKVPAANPDVDWTGFHVGAHTGYATGYSRWSDTGAAWPGLTGSLDFFNAYDGFKGTGSYFAGLQAGYTHMLPSRLVLGAEADVTFPNRVGSSQVFSSAATGQASYAETVQISGTVRGRIGYAPGHWLIYATGGLAWTYDQFTRTQILGTPVGSTADPGTVEPLYLVPRIGAAAGAGIEVALPSSWSARLEYLYTGFGTRSVAFPAGAQRFDSDLAIQSVRLGFNYRIGRDAVDPAIFTKGLSALDLDRFSLHGQTTFIQQYAFPFRSPYRGANSLDPNQGRETWDMTFYAGVKLWEGAELWINPEVNQGFGLSGTLGVAGFPSGAAFKIGASVPYARIQRSFIRQTIDLGGEIEKVEADANQFAGAQTANRLVITAGKLSVSDIFDTNRYSQNPRKDFMNWALIDTGSFDYAADAWGYTYGAAAELYWGNWTVRGGVFDLSVTPNNTDLDPRFQQFQWIGEVERRYALWGQPGKIAVTGFLGRGRMGRFEDAIQLAQITGGPADIAAVRRYNSRGGVSMNLEQRVSEDLGVFARAGMTNGTLESYEYTDIDRTIAAGLALNGRKWGRPDDTFGLAGVANGISRVHEAFLDAGGLGILVGDGTLPNPGLEKILEAYYSFPLLSWRMTLDYQFIANPAYNRDRGPVSIIGTRLRAQF
jgi:high affinity Mn2+ porin